MRLILRTFMYIAASIVTGQKVALRKFLTNYEPIGYGCSKGHASYQAVSSAVWC
jgi:hypothetical protein